MDRKGLSGYNPDRRRFLKKTMAALSGAYLGFAIPHYFKGRTQAGPNVRMQYRPLGDTGLVASEIGFGGYPVRDHRVVEYAIDRGINYIDTAWDYTGGVSEETIGKAMSSRRDEVVLTTKWHPWSKTSAEEMLEQLNTSLTRLKTDHVDFLLVHQVGKNSGGDHEGIERLQNPELFKAMDIARRQGKVRYFGCSGHDPDLMQIMNYALDLPDIKLILCRYNFSAYPEQPELFHRAREKGIATIAMKTLAGARVAGIQPDSEQGQTFKQGALKWVLKNNDLSNLIISISSKEQVDEYVLASGRVMKEEELVTLQNLNPRLV